MAKKLGIEIITKFNETTKRDYRIESLELIFKERRGGNKF